MRAGWSAETWRVREIVRRHGYNSTSYQILNPGFSYWIDSAHDAAVGYVEAHHTRVVGGAPVCRDRDLDHVLQAFEADAAHVGCGVVYFCAEDRLAEHATRDPLRRTFPIGAQPFWHPAALVEEFSLHSSLRAQIHRAENKRVAVHEDGRGDAPMAALRQCLAEWIGTRKLPALHFLIETETLNDLQDRRLFIAQRDSAVLGFMVATPIPARQGWLIEQIVRGRAAPNGTAELLLYHAARAFAADGSQLLTLGLAPLAQRGPVIVNQAPGSLRVLLSALRTHARNFYNFAGLEAFKAKFGGAEWSPVYASLSPTTSIRRALMAIAGAFSGEPLRRFVPHVLARAARREAQRLIRGGAR